MEELILGIDGGGTKTVALLARAVSPDKILGRGLGGPSNQRAVGPVMAMNHLEQAVQEAFDDARQERQTVQAACLGLAGADRPSDRRVVEDWAQETRLAHRIQVVNDAVPLLHVSDCDGCGVALIAGTGSLAWGRNQKNQTARSGGWGYLFGDEGSAFSVGRAVLQAAVRYSDGRGPVTSLLEDVIRKLGIVTPADIVAAVYASEIPRGVIAGLAPLAFEAAARQDMVADDILNDAAGDLATMVEAVARQLQLQKNLALVLSGAILLQQEYFRELVSNALISSRVQVRSTTLVAEPAQGAVRMAQALAGE